MNKEKIITEIDKEIGDLVKELPENTETNIDKIMDGAIRTAILPLEKIKKFIQSAPEENIHELIYNFVAQYSGGVSLAIDIQDNELLSNYIYDYLNQKEGEQL